LMSSPVNPEQELSMFIICGQRVVQLLHSQTLGSRTPHLMFGSP
jgi:hypothetical protein